MRRASYSLLWATVLASAVLAPAGSAVAASGTTTSAGDQQYLDPLASSAPSPPPSPASESPRSAPATAPAGPARATANAAAHDPSGRSLPYTGFNAWVLVWVGVALIALGLVLRGLTRRRAGPHAP